MTNSSLSSSRGLCPVPFFDEAKFPLSGGIISGRICIPVPQLDSTCCVPCPYTDWMYADGFEQRTEIASWVNVAAMFSTLFVLISYAVLPVKWTSRHYLSVCLAIGVFCIEMAFLIPLASKPNVCFNEITPNDMRSDLSCAFSGAFLIFGGWAVVLWVFWRALALHLQICWEVATGNLFFWVTLIVGWLIPAAGVTLTLSLTGVSYRFGNVCHINHKLGLEDFWGPLLAFATLALVLQFITIGYCINVYVRSLLDDKATTENSSGVPTYSGSITTASARQAYRRVKKVIQLQWRGATIVLLIIGEVVFFSVIFVSMDNSSQVNQDLLQRATPWVTCLALTGGSKQKCLPQAADLVKNESIVIAVLVCLGMSGFWLLIFLGRWSMILGWRDMLKSKILRTRHEFVSADARRFSNDPRTYEMLDSTNSAAALKISSPDRVLSPGQAHPLRSSPMTPEPDFKHEDLYFDRQTSVRVNDNISPQTPVPAYSYSSNTPAVYTRDWDARATHARSNYPPGTAMSKDYT